MEPIIVRYLEDNEKPDRWELIQPLTFLTPAGPVTVPAGHVTDFASSPDLLWSFFPPIGRANRAYILHDYWYDNRLFEDQLGAKAARRLADQELLTRMNQTQPDRPVRNRLMYLACRWFGRPWWED